MDQKEVNFMGKGDLGGKCQEHGVVAERVWQVGGAVKETGS